MLRYVIFSGLFFTIYIIVYYTIKLYRAGLVRFLHDTKNKYLVEYGRLPNKKEESELLQRLKNSGMSRFKLAIVKLSIAGFDPLGWDHTTLLKEKTQIQKQLTTCQNIDTEAIQMLKIKLSFINSVLKYKFNVKG